MSSLREAPRRTPGGRRLGGKERAGGGGIGRAKLPRDCGESGGGGGGGLSLSQEMAVVSGMGAIGF